MNILFGMKLDGARWTYEKSSVCTVTYGPMQMLDWLEEYLGLGGIHASEPERINQYLKKIKESNPQWCKKSFELDSWSTSKQLLSLRDELILNGWNKKDGRTERLDALVAIENSACVLSSGIPDRLNDIINNIPSFNFSVKIELYDDIELLPYLWKRIFEALELRGASVVKYAHLSANKPNVVKVSGENEFSLAKELARFLALGDNSTTAIICEDNTSVLDGILHRFGFGRIGNPYKSKWRESLQILPLWLKTLWKPFNAQQFLELLMLPISPIPKVLRRNLIDAIQKSPGKGGDSWNKAWDKTVEDIKRLNKEDPDAQIKRTEEIWNFLNYNSYFADESVSGEDVIERCDVLIKRLVPFVHDNPEVALAISQTKTLKLIVSDKTQITATELDRILDSIISTGTDGNVQCAECNVFDVYKDPGMILKDYDNVIWWNCVGNKTSSITYWSKEEIKVMQDFSISGNRVIDSASWHNAPSHARKNFICFVPKVVNGEETFAHPILDEYSKVQELSESDLVSDKGLWKLLDRNVQLTSCEITGVTVSNSFKADKEKFAPVSLSYTQLNDFISCPTKWMLKFYIELKQADSMSIPSGSLMIGTLAHKVVQNIYNGKSKLTEDEARVLALKEFDKLVPQMAAELLGKGNEVDLKRYKTLLVDSVKNLVKEINKHSLIVVANEKPLQGNFEGVKFVGYSDIVLKDNNGEEFVIDMKWSYSKDYENKYNNDEALQLAIYSWLLCKNKNISCAYYLFPKKKFIYENGKDWHGLIEKAKGSYRRRLETLENGILTKGNEQQTNLGDDCLKIKPGCDYCEFKDFCDVLSEAVHE